MHRAENKFTLRTIYKQTKQTPVYPACFGKHHLVKENHEGIDSITVIMCDAEFLDKRNKEASVRLYVRIS